MEDAHLYTLSVSNGMILVLNYFVEYNFQKLKTLKIKNRTSYK